MLPVWIIDLGESASLSKNLIVDSTGAAQRPYWHYYHPEGLEVTDAESYKRFMDAIVADGQNCYNAFTKSGYRVGNFQIVLLGAAHESLSQSIFAALPGLLRDNLPRIISDHANRGVEITGILYIPSILNQIEDKRERNKAALFLEEINMLNDKLGSKHFNHVIAYQDIQYKESQYYPRLDAQQRTELQYQILVHLFYASEDKASLFDTIGCESGCLSLGVASLYYNSEQHHGEELNRLLDKMLVEFKDEANNDADYSAKFVRKMMDEETLSPESITARLRENCNSLDIDLRKMDKEADPHPVWDLFCSHLFARYYHSYLKYMPARLAQFLQSLKYLLLTKFSAILKRNRETATVHFREVLNSFYNKILLDDAARYATISQLESAFSCAKDLLNDKQSRAIFTVQEIVPIPQYLRNDYENCIANEAENSLSLLMEKLKRNLKKEPVVLSLIARCFLLGILLVFTVIPILRFVSPRLINLGEIGTMEWLWIPILFLLPLIIEFFIKLSRHFKRIKRLKYRMLAQTLLEVNKRLSKTLNAELLTLYSDLAQVCDEQLERLAAFRDQLLVSPVEAGVNVIPTTMFNQPLIGGSFCGEKILEDETAAEAEILSNDTYIRLSELEKETLITMLKASFKQPEELEEANLSDNKEIGVHATNFITLLGNWLHPQLRILSADTIGQMMNMLHWNISPWEKMSGVNGMLFSAPSHNQPILRISNYNPPLLHPSKSSNLQISNPPTSKVTEDPATKDYAFLTCWQKIVPGIQSTFVCNCSLDPLPELSFSDKLSLYYGFYRQQDLAYTLAGIPILISKEEMNRLHHQIIGE